MKKSLLTGMLALLATQAWGADDRTGFYLNGNLGQAQYDISQEDLDDIALFSFESAGLIVLEAESSFDDEGTPFSLVAGYRFNRYVAVEAGYLDLGEAQYRATGLVDPIGPVAPLDASLDLDVSAEGPILGLVAFAPIGEKFDLHARGGMFFADVTLDVRAAAGGASESDDFSASSEDFFLGAGAAYHFTHHVAAQRRGLGVVERAAIGFADRGTGCGDDNRFFHDLSCFSVGG